MISLLLSAAHKFLTPLVTGSQFAHYLYMQVMKEWLESIIVSLQKGAAENANQLVSAVCVTHCLRIINLGLDDKFALPLVRMLYLRFNLERKECPDYLYLCDLLPKECR